MTYLGFEGFELGGFDLSDERREDDPPALFVLYLDMGVRRDTLVEGFKRFRQISLGVVKEDLDVFGQTKCREVGGTFFGKVGRQVRVRVLEFTRSYDPDFPASQSIPESLEDTYLIGDAFHTLLALFVFLDNEMALDAFDHPVEGDVVLRRIVLDLAVYELLDDL